MLKYVYRYDSGQRLRAITQFEGLFGYMSRILLKSKWGVRWSAVGLSDRALGQEACSASRGNGISPERQTQLFFPSLEARCWPLSLPFCSCFIYFPLWRLVFLLYRGCGTVTLCGLSIQAPRINSRVHLSSYNNQGEQKIGSFGPTGLLQSMQLLWG